MSHRCPINVTCHLCDSSQSLFHGSHITQIGMICNKPVEVFFRHITVMEHVIQYGIDLLFLKLGRPISNSINIKYKMSWILMDIMSQKEIKTVKIFQVFL